jgi:PBP1b-binding outer membrane lipoprotein LpoB
MSGQRKQKIITVLAVFLLILFLVGCSKPKEPKLLLSEESWHYEKLPQTNSSSLFILKNEGEEKLTLNLFYSSVLV